MRYLQVEINTKSEWLEAVETELIMLGIVDYAIEDPKDIEELLVKKTGYEWDYIDDEVLAIKEKDPKVFVYFPALEEGDENYEEESKRAEELVEAIQNNVRHCATFVSVQMNDDTEWKDKWKQYFKPKKVSNSIVVKPTWEEYERQEGDLVIEIDPGMAFGTGTHETTSLCIKLMEKYMKKGDNVLDVGCGSGILSIAGVLLGASDVLGIEIDPVAVEISNENLALNKCEGVARAVEGDLTKGVSYEANIVVANLMADLVIMLSKDVMRHLKADGYYISSGILVEKKEVVSQAIVSCGFEIVEIKEDGMWCAIVAKRA